MLRVFNIVPPSLVLACAAIPSAAQSTAILQGSVVEAATGKPIPAALVIATRTTLPPFRQTVQSNSDGNFQISNLPAGAYSLCARFASDGYLDSCEWGQSAPSVAAVAGQTSSAIVIRVVKASVLKVHIQDSNQLLFQKTSAGAVPDLTIGVFGPHSIFYSTRLDSRAVTSADYHINIPFDTPLSLSVMSQALQLADATGAALPRTGIQVPFQHATGNPNPPSFSYTVLGLAH